MAMQKLYKIVAISFAVFGFFSSAIADDQAVRPAIFSTSTDWESITGLRLREYNVTFIRDRTQGTIGTELYFLDSFPCYGQAYSVRAWVSPSYTLGADKDAKMRITCLFEPSELKFAWREATEKETQGRTTGIMTCEVKDTSGSIKIKLGDCEMGKKWQDM